MMTVNLPLSGSPVYEAMDVAHVAEALSPENRSKLPTLRMVLAKYRKHINSESAVKSVESICIKADGSVVLVRVGPRGGHKVLWKFGVLGR